MVTDVVPALAIAHQSRSRTTPPGATRVLFRVFKHEHEVVALFPELPAGRGTVMSYAHIGQHSEADLGYMLNNSRPAKPAEYKALLAELTRIGYTCYVPQ